MKRKNRFRTLEEVTASDTPKFEPEINDQSLVLEQQMLDFKKEQELKSKLDEKIDTIQHHLMMNHVKCIEKKVNLYPHFNQDKKNEIIKEYVKKAYDVVKKNEKCLKLALDDGITLLEQVKGLEKEFYKQYRSGKMNFILNKLKKREVTNDSLSYKVDMHDLDVIRMINSEADVDSLANAAFDTHNIINRTDKYSKNMREHVARGLINSYAMLVPTMIFTFKYISDYNKRKNRIEEIFSTMKNMAQKADMTIDLEYRGKNMTKKDPFKVLKDTAKKVKKSIEDKLLDDWDVEKKIIGHKLETHVYNLVPTQKKASMLLDNSFGKIYGIINNIKKDLEKTYKEEVIFDLYNIELENNSGKFDEQLAKQKLKWYSDYKVKLFHINYHTRNKKTKKVGLQGALNYSLREYYQNNKDPKLLEKVKDGGLEAAISIPAGLFFLLFGAMGKTKNPVSKWLGSVLIGNGAIKGGAAAVKKKMREHNKKQDLIYFSMGPMRKEYHWKDAERYQELEKHYKDEMKI